MNKFFTLLFVTSSLSTVYAQTNKFTAENNPCKENFTVDSNNPADHFCHNFVNNNTSGTLNLLWKRYDILVPAGWEPTVCDNVNCYATFVTSCPEEYVNTIAKGGKMLADMHMYDAGIQGKEACITLKVFEKEDTSNFINIEYFFNKETIGTNNTQRNIQFRMYPNPAQDQFYVDYNTGLARIEMYNVVGSKVLTFRTEPSKAYNISSLEEGVYMVKFITTENKVLKTLKLVKRFIRS